MPQSCFCLDASTAETQDVPQGSSWWRRLPPLGYLQAFFTRISVSVIGRRDIRDRYFGNLRTIFAKFLALVRRPKLSLPLLIDFALVLQSARSGRQLGPDVVYPMLSTRKRQSGRLANLILEHSRHESLYELRATSAFPRLQDIYYPCVAVIDLDDTPDHTYSAQHDFFGHICMAMFLHIFVTLIVHVCYLWDQERTQIFILWVGSALLFCIHPAAGSLASDGNLTLTRRSKTSTPGSVVLLDQNFTVILNGNRDVVEALVESGFTVPSPEPPELLRPSQETPRLVAARDLLVMLLEAFYLCTLVLLCLLFRPLSRWWFLGAIVTSFLSLFIPQSIPGAPPFLKTLRMIPPVILTLSLFTSIYHSAFLYLWILSGLDIVFLACAFMVKLASRVPNYPIQTAKLLDALGHPRVRKWQFDTLAKAVTFQCLVVCRGISRPIRSIEVAAFVDLLVPDETPVWKAWKNRVADRILFEANIEFAPMIPTFPDERQKELKDLLDQAQFAYDTYKHAFT